MGPIKLGYIYNLVARIINKTMHPYLTLYQTVFNAWFRDSLNSVDHDRLKWLGPDRVCAEWLIRNGAQVKLKTQNEFITLYEQLPPQDSDRVRDFLVEASAVNVDITFVGFDHFKDCKHLKKIVFNSCQYVDDRALPKLIHLRDCLEHLEIISCKAATDVGILNLVDLRKLKVLVLRDLSGVKEKAKCEATLRTSLPAADLNIQM